MKRISIFSKFSTSVGRLLLIIGFLLVLGGCRNKMDDAIDQLSKSIDYSNQATAITNKGNAYEVVNEKDMNQIIELRKKALYTAKLVNTEKLDKELGAHVKEEYIQGLELVLKGYDDKYNLEQRQLYALTGEQLLNSWGDWLSNKKKE